MSNYQSSQSPPLSPVPPLVVPPLSPISSSEPGFVREGSVLVDLLLRDVCVARRVLFKFDGLFLFFLRC